MVWTTSKPAKMVEFPAGIMGMALNLETDNVFGVVYLRGSDRDIKEGDTSSATNSIVATSNRNGWLVVCLFDASGVNPIDGKRPHEVHRSVALRTSKPPALIPRKSVHEPMATVLKSVDCD